MDPLFTTVKPPQRRTVQEIVEEMHRHVVGALVALHGADSQPSIPARIVGKWVTEFDDCLKELRDAVPPPPAEEP